MGKSQVDQPHKVYYGEDDGAGGGVFPEELVQQQASGAQDNQDKGGDFYEVFHLLNYNIFLSYLFPPATLAASAA